MFEQRTRCLCYRGGTAGAGAPGAALGAQAHHPRRHDQTVTAGESSTEEPPYTTWWFIRFQEQ